eukprot:CAMPEP_0171306778 /NCGR_PEP_ID=MMETSP0816-20121228/16820_1 /TAXON_ID=420281 /ORGANISM="Proboscia inermis, Strain CCAP1064/1" /LENGTH=570 /DNA_ID=CAMNT_0011788591 /DNA_START=28 /DNA_END=1737 /DNA_ORIENTATION=+
MTDLADAIFISLDGKADWNIQSNKMGRRRDIISLMLDLRKYHSREELPKGFVSFAKFHGESGAFYVPVNAFLLEYKKLREDTIIKQASVRVPADMMRVASICLAPQNKHLYDIISCKSSPTEGIKQASLDSVWTEFQGQFNSLTEVFPQPQRVGKLVRVRIYDPNDKSRIAIRRSVDWVRDTHCLIIRRYKRIHETFMNNHDFSQLKELHATMVEAYKVSQALACDEGDTSEIENKLRVFPEDAEENNDTKKGTDSVDQSSQNDESVDSQLKEKRSEDETETENMRIDADDKEDTVAEKNCNEADVTKDESNSNESLKDALHASDTLNQTDDLNQHSDVGQCKKEETDNHSDNDQEDEDSVDSEISKKGGQTVHDSKDSPCQNMGEDSSVDGSESIASDSNKQSEYNTESNVDNDKYEQIGADSSPLSADAQAIKDYSSIPSNYDDLNETEQLMIMKKVCPELIERHCSDEWLAWVCLLDSDHDYRMLSCENEVSMVSGERKDKRPRGKYEKHSTKPREKIPRISVETEETDFPSENPSNFFDLDRISEEETKILDLNQKLLDSIVTKDW